MSDFFEINKSDKKRLANFLNKKENSNLFNTVVEMLDEGDYSGAIEHFGKALVSKSANYPIITIFNLCMYNLFPDMLKTFVSIPGWYEKGGFPFFFHAEEYCSHISEDPFVIPGNIKIIGEWSLLHSGIKNIVMENGVEKIETSAFRGDYGAGPCYFYIPTSVKKIADLVFPEESIITLEDSKLLKKVDWSMAIDNGKGRVLDKNGRILWDNL